MCLTGKHTNQDKINRNMRGRGNTDSSGVVAANGVPLGLHPCRRDTPVVPPVLLLGAWEQEKIVPWEILLLHTGIAMRESL